MIRGLQNVFTAECRALETVMSQAGRNWLREHPPYRLLPILFRPLGNLYPSDTRGPASPLLSAKFYFPLLFNKNPLFNYMCSIPSFYQVCPIHPKMLPFPLCLWKCYHPSSPAQRLLITSPDFIMLLSYAFIQCLESTPYNVSLIIP